MTCKAEALFNAPVRGEGAGKKGDGGNAPPAINHPEQEEGRVLCFNFGVGFLTITARSKVACL
jgi:hypothetical protein